MTMASCSILTNSKENKINQDYIYCEVLEPIYWSKSDTEETLLQVKKHNELYKRLCPQLQK